MGSVKLISAHSKFCLRQKGLESPQPLFMGYFALFFFLSYQRESFRHDCTSVKLVLPKWEHCFRCKLKSMLHECFQKTLIKMCAFPEVVETEYTNAPGSHFAQPRFLIETRQASKSVFLDYVIFKCAHSEICQVYVSWKTDMMPYPCIRTNQTGVKKWVERVFWKIF